MNARTAPSRGRNDVATPSSAAHSSGSGVAMLNSRDLFAGAREIIIEHQGDQYRLRCTSKGKLILTK